jgi:hypothetical protein
MVEDQDMRTAIVKEELLRDHKVQIMELTDRVENAEALVRSLQSVIVRIQELNPSSNDQWVEQRLRALEHNAVEVKRILGKYHVGDEHQVHRWTEERLQAIEGKLNAV